MNTTNVDDKNIELETYTYIKDIRHNCYDIKTAFKKYEGENYMPFEEILTVPCSFAFTYPHQEVDNLLSSIYGIKKDFISIKKVIFNDPATIVYWKDGTKTIVKCQKGDTYDKEKGLALCFMKKLFKNKGNFNDIFRKYITEEEK